MLFCGATFLRNYDNMAVCFVCGGTIFTATSSEDYSACECCGYELKKDIVTEPLIINDPLSLADIKKVSWLERFKLKTIENIAIAHDFIVDVGSSSGKFLYYVKDKFKEHLGIEITPESIAFSRDVLGLTISPSLSAISDKKISVVTFWHSLEHIPADEINNILKKINLASTPESRVVISVPNAGSTLYRMLGRKFAYHDSASHMHQFSRNSLDKLLSSHGFEPTKQFYSFAYAMFGYLQSSLNLGNLRLNFLYYYLKRGRKFGLNKPNLALLLGYNALLCVIFAIPALLGAIYDLMVKDYGTVLTICYRPKQSIL